MTLIKIIDLPRFETSSDKIAQRLQLTLTRIRLNKCLADPQNNFRLPEDFDGEDFEVLDSELLDEIELDRGDLQRIRNRADKLSRARRAAAGITHLKPEDLNRLTPALNGMKVVTAKDLNWADEVAAKLHAEMPWMKFATDHLWKVLRRIAVRGDPLTLRPVILNGPPGIGKSVWARSVAIALSVPSIDIDASKGGAGIAVAGLERGWSSSVEGQPIGLLLSKRIANPLIVVDEICKGRTATSNRGTYHAFSDSLLSLLEPATAAKWECPFFRVRFNMSHISWVLTSNVIENVPETLRSRCQIIEIPDLTTEQLQSFAYKKGSTMGLSKASVEAVAMAIALAPKVTKRRQSLRDVLRMLERAQNMDGGPRLH
ncbi:AAA family ATPase [Thalassorhabdomicrobium marinisediminis]|uniref:Peptidase n=1 Tax=Thalassorhabdomicrobium marinisediminis TaxID=2170577 RepID=A0A2T7FY90_9RHOB|nr:AAA family ATPase [Thalassorhabdomicrobium marinisediminis]PVA07132.1 peptidase [Thalassorhabdomicrobium marinisediminis]